ncbi:glycosyltransferase family 4 protein [Maribacter sp. 1_MG-2023]|uniref:glycosyltransferase family 4 protein n=1 Tax=Maribacter sp. 1_MG-2023 TaxID=3062677 RepID=UPI0026E12EAC|nr:glycosyltransferase family 4 protein [Maribacter sp. 1_MG-2023]MDO6472355.1 glycosyltransferase family 4 protein [Maribacter sp. 1_MG-2023]
MKIAILGNYLPRRCGIATFTTNLTESIINSYNTANEENEIFVIAMENGETTHDYPEIVSKTINQNEPLEYDAAARYINDLNADICIIQHEFGIFGGASGVFILRLMSNLQMTIITTVHTILKTPSFHEKHIIKKMGELSEKMIVMSHLAVDFLNSIYKIPKQKIVLIQHGVPDFTDVKKLKKFNYGNRKVLGTFGFLGRSKGIETVINALPSVVKNYPDVVYIVMGQTHPNVKKHSGESYRDYLKNLAIENGVADYVIFEDGFFEEEDLKSFLVGLDFYITPYINEAQITSGTISYAIGAGACTISTPFWHAKELLADGRGKTFDFNDSDKLSQELCNLLKNPKEADSIRKIAFEYGKKMYWPQIGKAHHALFKEVKEANKKLKNRNNSNKIKYLPSFGLDHLKRLTDVTGILEHANYSVPDYKEGYCLDDNVRALLVVLMANEQHYDDSALKLADTYLRYIKLMQQDNGYFHNDMSFDKRFLDMIGSEDSFGRTIWSMGYLIKVAANDNYLQFAKDVFFKSFQNFEKIKSIRAISYIILGISYFLERYPGDESLLNVLNSLSMKLLQQYNDENSKDWRWFEPILSYDNALMPLALWHTYAITKERKVLEVALETTIFLDEQIHLKDRISLVGNSWQRKGQLRSSDGQQPIDAMAMVMLYRKAFDVTKNNIFYEKMHTAFSWFLGNNDLLIPLYDAESKGCCDGLGAEGINRNQGAESTISYLISYLTVQQLENANKSENHKTIENQREPNVMPFNKVV